MSYTFSYYGWLDWVYISSSSTMVLKIAAYWFKICETLRYHNLCHYCYALVLQIFQFKCGLVSDHPTLVCFFNLMPITELRQNEGYKNFRYRGFVHSLGRTTHHKFRLCTACAEKIALSLSKIGNVKWSRSKSFHLNNCATSAENRLYKNGWKCET